MLLLDLLIVMDEMEGRQRSMVTSPGCDLFRPQLPKGALMLTFVLVSVAIPDPFLWRQRRLLPS